MEQNVEYLTEWPIASDDRESPPPSKVLKKDADIDKINRCAEDNDEFEGFEAKTALAIWLRKKKREEGDNYKRDPNVSKNVKCEFNRLRRSSQAKDFLRSQIENSRN